MCELFVNNYLSSATSAKNSQRKVGINIAKCKKTGPKKIFDVKILKSKAYKYLLTLKNK